MFKLWKQNKKKSPVGIGMPEVIGFNEISEPIWGINIYNELGKVSHTEKFDSRDEATACFNFLSTSLKNR